MYLVKANYSESGLCGHLILQASNHQPMLRFNLIDYNYDVNACEKHAFDILKILNDES